ncbi:MAG: HdaA/DnaA family protein [Burkholderiaceae bacterium]
MQQQLLLDVFTPPPARLDNFLTGDNAELLAQVRQHAVGTAIDRTLFIHGPSGCGKSHLLKALAAHWRVPAIDGRERFGWRRQAAYLLVDDVQHLSSYSQVQLFNAINEARNDGMPQYVVMTGDARPEALGVRDDLGSRLAWGLCYALAPLSDAQKSAALQAAAAARGLHLSDEVIDFAQYHFRRDMGSLLAVLDGLDQFSLEQHKPVSLNLLRAWMKRRASLVIRNS